MNRPAIIKFLRSPAARLTASYLAIIMVMSVGFSLVFYQTSAHELGRQVPSSSFFDDHGGDPGLGYHRFFERRIDEGRHVLLGKLVLLNLLVLVAGAMLSYYLARRTLEPIEDAMDAQARFVTDASHELRTPLTAMLAENEVALRKSGLTLPQAKAVIESNTEELAKLKGLSDGLLSLAKQDNNMVVHQPVSLQEIAGEVMNRVIKSAQAKQITIEDKVPDLKVSGDPQGLVQAAVILLDNAIKYSPKKGAVTLEGFGKDNKAYLSVRDEGVGISPVDLPHIFDRFYRADLSRTKSDTEGYGIGLSIAQKIAGQHHGRITVSSAPGKGSTFTLELPAFPSPQ